MGAGLSILLENLVNNLLDHATIFELTPCGLNVVHPKEFQVMGRM